MAKPSFAKSTRICAATRLQRFRQEIWRLAHRRAGPVPRRGRRLALLAGPPAARGGRAIAKLWRRSYADIGAGKMATRPAAARRARRTEGGDVVRASALFTRAAVAIEQNDRKLGHRQISRDRERRGPCRSPIATSPSSARRTLEFDTLKPEEVIARLQPLAKPGQPWFGSAGELTAMAYDQARQEARSGPPVRGDRRRQASSGIHSRPRGADRRHPGRRCQRVAARRSAQ